MSHFRRSKAAEMPFIRECIPWIQKSREHKLLVQGKTGTAAMERKDVKWKTLFPFRQLIQRNPIELLRRGFSTLRGCHFYMAQINAYAKQSEASSMDIHIQLIVTNASV